MKLFFRAVSTASAVLAVCITGGLLTGCNVAEDTAATETTTESIRESGLAGPLHIFDSVVETVEINPLSHPQIDATEGKRFGTGIAVLGDLDGDKGAAVQVLAVANSVARGGPEDETYWGSIHLLYLLPDGSVLKTARIHSGTPNAPPLLTSGPNNFGSALASLGDLDGDGESVAVLAVGSVWSDDGRGGVTLLYLLPDGSILKSATIDTATPNGPELYIDMAFGLSLAVIGDIDGPGGSSTVLAASGPYILTQSSEGPSLEGVVFLLYLLPDGSLLRTVTIDARAPGIPPGQLEPGNGFGRGLAWLGHAGRPDDLSAGVLAVGVPGGSYGGRESLHDRSGDVYLLRLNPDGSILSTDIINVHTPHIDGYRDSFGESLSTLTPLVADHPTGVAYALVVGTYIKENGSKRALFPIYLHEDLSVYSAALVDGRFPNGFSSSNLDDNSYWEEMVYLGALDPRRPNRHTIAATGLSASQGKRNGVVFLHTLDR